jgi:hypothetical protein
VILHRHTAAIHLSDPQPAGAGEVSVAVAYLQPIALAVAERYTVGVLIWAGWTAADFAGQPPDGGAAEKPHQSACEAAGGAKLTEG